MENILLIFICLISGFSIQKLPHIPKNTHQGINLFIIYISLPAVTLLFIPQVQWDWTTLGLISVCGTVFLGGWLFFKALLPIFKWDKKTFACLLLTGGMCNTSFVGFPMTELFYGSEGLKLAILVDQGAFFALTTFGIGTTIHFSEGKVQPKVILRKIVLFPPFIAFVLALIFQFWEYPIPVVSVLEKLSATLVPMALFSVGFQLKFQFKPQLFRDLGIGLIYKLLLAPFLIFCVQFYLFGKNDLTMQVAVIESAMPPMVTSSILASTHQLNPDLAQLITGLGILIGFATTIFWFLVL